MDCGLVGILGLALLFVLLVAKTAVVVPQENAYVVERLGRYTGSLGPGFHILLPWVDVVRYRHSLKEQVVEVPRQICATLDERQVEVNAFLRFKITDPEKASYAVSNYFVALLQLTQAVLHQELSRLEADRAREEWAPIAAAVASEMARKTEPWGIAVLGFEIENLTLPS